MAPIARRVNEAFFRVVHVVKSVKGQSDANSSRLIKTGRCF
jgi:hypothetical protein